MKRTIFYILITGLLLFLVFGFSVRQIKNWIDEIGSTINSEKEYTFNSELPNSKIFLHNDLELDVYELNSIKNLIEYSIIEVDSILPNDIPKVSVYLTTGNGSAITTPKYNKITLYNSEHCYAAFCHEYIHAVLGVHEELWFSEGIATFLGQHIRSKSKKLKKYCDSDETLLINERTLTSGPLKRNADLKSKYSYNTIKELMLNTNNFNELTDDNVLDFYFFSASFCKYLFDTIGEEEMINLILKMDKSHNSISKEFKNREIKLDNLMNFWLIEY